MVTPRSKSWIECDVVANVAPQGLAIGVHIDGQERSFIVWDEDVVKVTSGIPGKGQIRITLVARLPQDDPFGEGFLAELPAIPVDGTQRIRIRPNDISEIKVA